MMPAPRALLPTLLLVLSLSACGVDGAGDGGGNRDRLQVAAGFYALEYLTERVGGEHVEVTSLTTPGQEPHDAELSMTQTAEVAESDLVVHLSGFQPAVDDAVTGVAQGAVVDVAETAALVVSGTEHEDQRDRVEEEGNEDEGEVDPHFWLDPERMATVGRQVTEALIQADPDNAQDYRANLAAVEDELGSLATDLEQGLAACKRDVVVVSHDAFGYLAQHTGLDFHSIAGLSPDAEPSVQHVRELQDIIRSEGITTVFTERLASQQMAQTLSSDLGLKTAVLDPVEGLADETADEDYLSLMRQNLDILREANGCR